LSHLQIHLSDLPSDLIILSNFVHIMCHFYISFINASDRTAFGNHAAGRLFVLAVFMEIQRNGDHLVHIVVSRHIQPMKRVLRGQRKEWNVMIMMLFRTWRVCMV